MKLLTLAFLPATLASCIRRSGGTEFDYSAAQGPLNWHNLDAENTLCATGDHQSPIDILSDSISHIQPGSLHFSIPSTNGTPFENLGTGLEVGLSAGTLIAKNHTYTLAQFHFHTPSEHRINGEYFPLEVHFVFQDPAGKTAVVGFVFQLSEISYSSPVFRPIFDSVHSIPHKGDITTTPPLDFWFLEEHIAHLPVYNYQGSLTTPPCTEGLEWFVSAVPVPVDVRGYNAVKRVVGYNARNTQSFPGEGNVIKLYS